MDENKGQNNKSHIEKYGGPAPLDFFNNAPLFTFFFKKTEKVITALYMVTGLLADAEPIKWKIRSLGAEMLSLTNSLKDKFSTERDSVVHALKSHILEVSSLLDISKYAGLMSDMNVGILNNELKELGSMFERDASYGANSGSLIMDHSFFSTERTHDARTGAGASIRNETVAYPKKHSDMHETPKAHAKPVRTLQSKDHADEGEFRRKTEKKDHRRDAILAVIRKKGKVTIKDVSLTMQEVSEKTIQRELSALIEEGILKKEGERRWSRYSLAGSV